VKVIRVALLGHGVVGSAVAKLLVSQGPDLAARIGRPVELVGVAVRRPERHPDISQELLTTDSAPSGSPAVVVRGPICAEFSRSPPPPNNAPTPLTTPTMSKDTTTNATARRTA